ncbi:MAG TPA: hypothetical protein VM783_17820 [Candidatus Acidoferrum sp.]|nr:hypothetical protein [Candidatus Acidoferrum sp.]
MSKAASVGDLQDLHSIVARSLSETIRLNMQDGLPTDAATLGAAIKFLKDNSISADPADSDDLSELRDRLAKQQAERRASRSNVVQLASSDLKVMEG